MGNLHDLFRNSVYFWHVVASSFREEARCSVFASPSVTLNLFLSHFFSVFTHHTSMAIYWLKVELSRSYGWPHTTNAIIWPPRSLETPTKKAWKVSQASPQHRGFIPTTRAPKTLRANETEFELQLGHVRHSPLHLLFKLSRVLQD